MYYLELIKNGKYEDTILMNCNLLRVMKTAYKLLESGYTNITIYRNNEWLKEISR